MADDGPVYELLHICCEVGLKKRDHYFKLAHKSHVFSTAMVMDPRLKKVCMVRAEVDHAFQTRQNTACQNGCPYPLETGEGSIAEIWTEVGDC
jgi:hypothetical protein